MQSRFCSVFVVRRASGVAVACLALLAAPAQATLDPSVSVSLVVPGGIVGVPGAFSVTDVVSTLTGIIVGDSTQIGTNYMLPGESISFAGNAIQLTVAGGATIGPTWVTGYLGSGLNHALYVFSGLSIPGQTITGVTLSHAGAVLSGYSAALTAPGQVSFNLDQLTFSAPVSPASYPYGQFTINLQTSPVPEPAVWALALAGLGVLGLRRRFVWPGA